MPVADHGDDRASHGTEACLDRARGRSRIRQPGGARLSKKLRMPKGDSWIARIARQERDDLAAEVSERKNGKLTVADYESLDTVYWCTAGLLKAYQHLEHHGWLDVEQHAFWPVVEQVGRLKRLKQDALARLGVDKLAEPRDVWVAASKIAASMPSSNEADSEAVESQERTGGDAGTSGVEMNQDASWSPVDSAGELRDK